MQPWRVYAKRCTHSPLKQQILYFIVASVIEERMVQYQNSGSSEIRFSLQALIKSPLAHLKKQLELSKNEYEKSSIAAEIASEEMKWAEWQKENQRRRHNYIGLIVSLFKEMAKKEVLKV